MLVQAPMLDLLHRHIDGKGKQAKLKSPNELQVSVSVSTPPLFMLSFCSFLACKHCVHMSPQFSYCGQYMPHLLPHLYLSWHGCPSAFLSVITQRVLLLVLGTSLHSTHCVQ